MTFFNLIHKKRCTKCGKLFYATTINFFKENRGKYGLRSKCKKCFIAEASVLKRTPEYREISKERQRKYYRKNKEKYSKRWSKYYEKNAETLRAKARKYGKENRDRLCDIDKKRREDPKFRVSQNISRSIRQSLFRFNGKDGAHWETLVGYTKNELSHHLEKQFQPGMTWGNYGEWHIDHIIPVSAFNFTDPTHEDFKRCWSLKNLRPLWAFDNISKGAKLLKHFQPSLQLQTN